MSTNKRGLGKGLGALFSGAIIPEIDDKGSKDNITVIHIEDIKPNKDQPRKTFDEKLLRDLAASIKEHGVLQPILVRPDQQMGGYQIIAGERRWRASKMAGLERVPVIIKDLKDLEVMEIALIENLQRANLNIIEEALGYKYLIDQHGMSQDEIASKVGKSRPVISNAIRLLKLPKEVIDLVREEKISAGHARALLSFNDEEYIKKEARKIIEEDLTVREIESAAKGKRIDEGETKDRKIKARTLSKITAEDESFYKNLQNELTQINNRDVKINYQNIKKSVEIEFYSKEDLTDIISKLKI